MFPNDTAGSYGDKMMHWPRGMRLRDRIAIASAIVWAPLFYYLVGSLGLVFAGAGLAAVLGYVVIVPLVILIADRLKFYVWQLAVASFSVTVIIDNLLARAIYPRQIATVLFGFWALGTLPSSPVPVYFLLRPMTPRRRYLYGIAIVAIGVGLWFGIKRIAR